MTETDKTPTPFDALRAIIDRNDMYEFVSRYKDIAEALEINPDQKKALQALVAPLLQDGLVERVQAFNEDGMLCGSGLIPTIKGRLEFKARKEEQQ